MATQLKPVVNDENTPLDLLDVSDAAIYAQDRWRPVFARLRAEAPIHYCASSPFGPYWSISRHAEIQLVEARPEVFSSDIKYGGITILDQEGEVARPQFIAMDRPQHGDQRRTVSPAFGPSEIARMGVEIRQRTAELLDTLPIGEEFDWVEKVSIELTTGMLAILFDFPWADRHLLTLWSDWGGDIEAMLDPVRKPVGIAHMNDMLAYFDALFAERKALPPSGDLISMMVHSQAMGDMPPLERMGNLILLIVGGNDTTRNSMSGAIEAFNLYPDQWAKLSADPKLATNAASEVIRWQTPLAHMRRSCTEDTEFEGHKIAKGDKLVMWYLSGNRDESIFPDAEKFDVERPNARRHLSFGFGVHRCVGARLAELQLQILFDEMIKRRMTVNITGTPERVPQSFVHGFKSLPVTIAQN